MKKVLFFFLVPLVVMAQQNTPPATQAEVDAGLIHTKFVAPDTLAAALAQQPTVTSSYTSNGLELNITNNLYLSTGLGTKFVTGVTNFYPYIQDITVGAGSGTVVRVLTNSSTSSMAWITEIIVGGSGAVALTNWFRVNFGQTFVNPPIVFCSIANLMGYGVGNSPAQSHVDYSTVTTSNFWFVSGTAALSANTTNHYSFMVIGK